MAVELDDQALLLPEGVDLVSLDPDIERGGRETVPPRIGRGSAAPARRVARSDSATSTDSPRPAPLRACFSSLRARSKPPLRRHPAELAAGHVQHLAVHVVRQG